jgi:hypothetical protein
MTHSWGRGEPREKKVKNLEKSLWREGGALSGDFEYKIIF